MQKQVNFSNQTRVLRLYILKTSVAASPTKNRSVNLKRNEFLHSFIVFLRAGSGTSARSGLEGWLGQVRSLTEKR